MIVLKVELIAGTEIYKACEELIELARKTDAMVSTKFNGVALNVVPWNNAGELADRYHAELQQMHKEPKP